MEHSAHAVMTATVQEVHCCHLLVCEKEICRQVLVHTDDACRYARGDCLCIHYNGIMTNSLPPQITADRIRCLPAHCC